MMRQGTGVIRAISVVHLSWGICLIAGIDPPAPFSSFQPFIEGLRMKPVWLGVVLLLTSFLPFLAATQTFLEVLEQRYPGVRRFPWIWPLILLPQQTILVWGVIWNTWDLVVFGYNPRLWYGGVQIAGFAAFHGLGIFQLIRSAQIRQIAAKAHPVNGRTNTIG